MNKILVIEDEDTVRENILELLEAEDFIGYGAANGRIGLELARSHLPDLIICDVLMPEVNGYGVLQTLRHDPLTSKIPFIFLTAKAAKADFRLGIEMGADEYITKPFTRAELLDALEKLLQKSWVS
jgi:CheY-like chemotaxis protein